MRLLSPDGSFYHSPPAIYASKGGRRVLKRILIVLAAVTGLTTPCAAVDTCIYLPTGAGPEHVCASVYPEADPIVVELGQAVPLPIHYLNGTDREMTFETVLVGNVIFPGSHTLHSATLAPHTELNYTDVVLQTDNAMPIGTDHIVIGWGATGGDYLVSAQTEFEITLVPPRELQDVIQLPCRWCVVEGSPQAEGRRAGELVNGSKLLKLLQRASDEIWMPQGQILFRSAIADGIPVVCDPDPPPEGRGKLGDVEDRGSGEYLSDPAGACEKAWERIAPGQPGRILVSTGAFHNAGLALGVSLGPGSQVRSPKLCSHPRTISALEAQFMERTSVVDQALYGVPPYSSGVDPVVVLAHEIGHQLFLGHGNGLDDNHDGTAPPAAGPRLFDEYCDALCSPTVSCANVPMEDDLTPSTTCEDSSSVMYYIAGTCLKLRPLQTESAREIASVAPGAVVNGTVNPGDGRLPDYARDPCDEVAGGSPRIIQDAGMTETHGGDTTQFYQVIPGTLEPGSQSEHLAFADLDNDPGTGCAAAVLGFPTTFQGAELVTEVSVDPQGLSASAAVWSCKGGVFSQVSDPRISAFVETRTARGAAQPSQRVVVLGVPDDVRGLAGDHVRLQTMARLLGQPDQVDRFPDSDAGALVSRIPPSLPQATLSRVAANPGGETAASASGLLPNSPFEAYLGEEFVGQGTTDGSGNAALDVHVPATSRQGVRPVVLLIPGTAVNAVGAIMVQGVALTPATTASLSPIPNRSDWNNSDATLTLDAVDVPGGPGIHEINYGATGAQPIPPVASPEPPQPSR